MVKVKTGLCLAIAVCLVGCSQTPIDAGARRVTALLNTRDVTLAQHVDARPTVQAEQQRQVHLLLAQPLNAERAVAVALLRSPVLRIEYAKLGLVQADVLDASRLSNPVISVSSMRSNAAGSTRQWDYGVVQNFTDVLFLRVRQRAARTDLQRGEAQSALAIQQLAADVTQAYYQLVLAEHLLTVQQNSTDAASVSARLAEQFYRAGNIDALTLSNQNANASQAELELERAKQAVLTARSTLARHMGLGRTDPVWTVDTQLPLPVKAESSLEQLSQQALTHRLDLTAKQQAATAYAQVLGLSHTLKWLPFVQVGLQGERDSSGARLFGPSVALELPIFGKNLSTAQRTQANIALANAEVDALILDIDQQVETAYQQMISARAQVQRYQNSLIPQREAVLAQTEKTHNAMLVGVFDLLQAKQQTYDAYRGQLQALHAYWMARTQLAYAVGARLPSDEHIGAERLDAALLVKGSPRKQPDAKATTTTATKAAAAHDMSNMHDMGDMSNMPNMGDMHDMRPSVPQPSTPVTTTSPHVHGAP